MQLFLNDDYVIIPIEMPGKFLNRDVGLSKCADRLAEYVDTHAFPSETDLPKECPLCGQETGRETIESEGADEINLICHGMGGVVALRYLMDSTKSNANAKMVVKRVITIESPLHGTTADVSKASDQFIPWLTGNEPGCWEEIKVDSQFMRVLH